MLVEVITNSRTDLLLTQQEQTTRASTKRHQSSSKSFSSSKPELLRFLNEIATPEVLILVGTDMAAITGIRFFIWPSNDHPHPATDLRLTLALAALFVLLACFLPFICLTLLVT